MKPFLAVAGVLLVVAAALILAPVAGNGWTSNAFRPYGNGSQVSDIGWFAYEPLPADLQLADPIAIAHRRKLEAAVLALAAGVTAGVGVARRGSRSAPEGVHE